MEAVYKGRPQKPNTEDKEGTALLGVVTDQRQDAGSQRQHGRRGFKQSMKLAVALPMAPVKQAASQKEGQSGEPIHPSPFLKLTRLQIFHFEDIGRFRGFLSGRDQSGWISKRR